MRRAQLSRVQGETAMRHRKEQPERFTLAQGAYALLGRYMALVLRIRGANINIINDKYYNEFQ